MVPEALRKESTFAFVREHSDALKALGLQLSNDVEDWSDDLLALKKHTIQNFGFEWLEYARFGWDDPIYNIQREEQVFRYKSLLKPDEIQGKLVLDAGCGNGRYSYWAAKYGGKVFGVDIGDGVESAAQNTGGLANVQIIQGDIFSLPFRDNTFDVIFAIGVLMHTGDARKATASLVRKLRVGGSLSVHLYGKGNIIYEYIDRILRSQTTRLSINELQVFTIKAYRLRRFLERIRLANIMNRFVNLDSHPHCIFDWYAAPIATHHTYEEVKWWFDSLGLRIVATNENIIRSRSAIKSLLGQFLGGAPRITVRGVLSS